jgi:hypothetical protein
MVNLMRGLQLGLTAATGQGPTSRDFKSQDLFGELQGMANPLESSQYQEFAQLSPQKASAFDKAIKVKGQAGIARKKALAQDVQKMALLAGVGKYQMIKDILVNRKSALSKIDPNANTSDTDQLLGYLENPTKENLEILKGDLAILEQMGIASGYIQGEPVIKLGPNDRLERLDPATGENVRIDTNRDKDPTSSLDKPATQRAFENLISDFTPEDKAKARRIAAGLDPRAQGSAASTIASLGTVEDVAVVESLLSQAREEGKGQAQLSLKPQITAAVETARARAASDGVAFTELNQANAALPGLRATVDSLKGLAMIATSTLGGRVFDTASKELGFGSTKGATAKAKFIAVINNQVLPLLKPTFGGSFSVQEGESLKNTMGDPNASPEEKIAVLNAFIDQKERDIDTKTRQLSINNNVLFKDAENSIDLDSLNIEELNALKQKMINEGAKE